MKCSVDDVDSSVAATAWRKHVFNRRSMTLSKQREREMVVIFEVKVTISFSSMQFNDGKQSIGTAELYATAAAEQRARLFFGASTPSPSLYRSGH